MKKSHSLILMLVGAACLVLSIFFVALGQSNQRLLLDAQQQQNEINRGNMSQQIGTNMLKDLAQISLKNEKVKALLAKNGYNVQVQPTSGPQQTPASSNP
jgi:signal transduction histidine kinase